MSRRRVAVITGAARGIGAAAAEALARGGVSVALLDVAEDAAEVRSRLAGFESFYHRVDVTQTASVSQAVAAVTERFGRIDILVNNAGILSTATIENLSEEEWRRVIDVNLTGAFLMTKAVLPQMRAGQWGRVVNIASMAGRMGGITVSCAYGASKAALIAMTWNLARATASDGVTVNAVAPGPVDGAMYAGFTDAQRTTLERSIPVGRLGTPEEIGRIVAFLASEDAGFITGAVIDANGGAFTG